MSDLVGNPEDRFSRVAAQIVVPFFVKIFKFLMKHQESKKMCKLNHQFCPSDKHSDVDNYFSQCALYASK